MYKFHLIFLPKVSPLECRGLLKLCYEILHKCLRYLVWFSFMINVDCNTYLSKHSCWNTIFCSSNTYQDGSLQASHVSYHSLSLWELMWALVLTPMSTTWWLPMYVRGGMTVTLVISGGQLVSNRSRMHLHFVGLSIAWLRLLFIKHYF